MARCLRYGGVAASISPPKATRPARRGRRAGLSTAIGHGLWAFVRTYFFKRGFLDGREGFILAVSNAEGTYYRYLKLMYLNAQRPPQ